jgi:Sulfotransferase family
MVQQALNRHSRIAIPAETKFFFSFIGRSLRAQRRHIDRLNRDLKISLTAPEARVSSLDEGRDFYEGMADKYVRTLEKSNVTCFGEKTPEHTSHITRIRDHFPKAKILVLIRDGRDVALSLAKAPWMPGGLYAGFLVWLYYQRILLAVQSELRPNMYFARYEDIVADPEGSFSEILDFLDLPYEPSVAHGWGNRAGIPQREYAWKANALKKITADRAGVFLRELDATQIADLERLGRDTLASFDYPLMTDVQTSLSARFLLKLARDVAGFAWCMPWHLLLQEFVDRAYANCTGTLSRMSHITRRARQPCRLGAY